MERKGEEMVRWKAADKKKEVPVADYRSYAKWLQSGRRREIQLKESK